ncbi:MAG: metal-dependent hydrolase [Candidatus Wallbacteria bacterium]|nr:metal-dependent hydrolase [Candidatus Wallbacteria bacterium]
MKGLTHFVSGVALATFSSQAVQLAENESSLILVIGGIFGILPDTLDFKVARFFSNEDYIVTPSPQNTNLQEIADTIALAIDRSFEEKKKLQVKLNTIKLGADLWRQYSVRFEDSEVVVKLGPVVNTSQVPLGAFDHDTAPTASAGIKCRVLHTYDSDTRVDIFSGPTFAFRRINDEMVEAEFLPWHRSWSHSLVLGAIFGLIGGTVYGLLTSYPGHWNTALLYAMVIFGGFSIHILEDQLGFMGSNLYWPITRNRHQGLKWMRSGDAWPNFITVWLALIAIIFNINRFSNERVFHSSFVEYLGYAFFLPLTFIIFVGFFTSRMMRPAVVNAAGERLKEVTVENEEEES